MKNGFLKVAVTTPDLRVADCQYNKNQMVEKVKKMADEKVSLVCFPEFSLTGYTCGDLFLHDTLVEGRKRCSGCILRGDKIVRNRQCSRTSA